MLLNKKIPGFDPGVISLLWCYETGDEVTSAEDEHRTITLKLLQYFNNRLKTGLLELLLNSLGLRGMTRRTNDCPIAVRLFCTNKIRGLHGGYCITERCVCQLLPHRESQTKYQNINSIRDTFFGAAGKGMATEMMGCDESVQHSQSNNDGGLDAVDIHGMKIKVRRRTCQAIREAKYSKNAATLESSKNGSRFLSITLQYIPQFNS